MAERRMFAKTVTESDAFLDMPLSAQALYFHLSIHADDDGFVNNPKKIQRTIGASEDDCKLLIMKRFILTFASGVIVIKHWRIHNYIQKDRYKPTVYTEERSLLTLTKNKAYSECIQNAYKMDTSCTPSIGKVSIEQVNTNEERKKEIDREKQTTNAHACESENVPDFSKMTDEELIAWGEGRSFDFDDADTIASFYAWNEETEKRAKNATKGQGKIIKSGGGLERLKSHAEVMTELGVSNVLRSALKEFLRYCYANRHLVTNEKLADIILRLDEACDDDDEAKCEYIRRAMGGGFFDVKAGR